MASSTIFLECDEVTTCCFSSTAVDGEMWLQLVGEYMLYRDDETAAEALHTVSCRLLLDIMPGLETSVIFQDNVCGVSCVIVT